MLDINSKKILNTIDKMNITVIAFDIFDTIIHRKVSPNHVHRMWAKQLIDFYDLDMSINKLVSLKFNARRFAKLDNLRKGFDKECRYEQMTKRLYKRLKVDEPYELFNNRCVDFELGVEKTVGYIDGNFLDLYNDLLRLNKKVIFISDFYLHRDTLYKLLFSKGLDIKEQQIYSSSDFCRTKISGNLYNCVLEKLGVTPDEILMIGDSKTSDYYNARSKGLNSYLVDSSRYYEEYNVFENKFENSKKSLDFLLKKEWVQNRGFPFSHVAFCMFSFVDNLYKQLIRDHRQDVFFLSREGELFKRLFDLYQELVIPNQNDRVNTYYLKVSRHSTLIGSIHEVEKDSFQEIYKNYPDLLLETFLKNLGLENNENILAEFRDTLLKKEVIKDFKNSSVYDRLLKSKVFQRECKTRAEQQREFFIRYLDSFKVNYRSEGLSLVDVGYSGTTQENIKKIFSDKVPIFGYYMFSYADTKTINSFNEKVGILYDKNNNARKKDYFAYNSAVIEMISLASHGSINEYKVENNIVIPTYNNIVSEQIAFKKVILPMQKNIENAFREICHFYSEGEFVKKDYYNRFLQQYRRFIFNPTQKEITMYELIPFVDNFAAYVTYDNPTISRQSVIKNIIKLILSCGRLIRKQNTHWVAVALNRLGLKPFNLLLYIFAPLSQAIFNILEILEKRKKGISS